MHDNNVFNHYCHFIKNINTLEIIIVLLKSNNTMKKQIFTLFFFSMILLSSGIEKNNFKIKGKAHGFPDNTSLYLFNPLNNTIVDSTYVINESFVFKGYVSELCYYIIQTKYEPKRKPPQQYKYLWITDTIISFDGTNGDLWFARIQGGMMQKQQNELDEIHYENNRALFNLIANYDTINKKNYAKLEKISIIQDSIMKVGRNMDIEFIKEHPNYLLSVYLLDFNKGMYGKELTREFFMLFPDDLKKSKFGNRIISYLEL